MKLHYPSPTFLQLGSSDILKYSHSVGILALSPTKELYIVKETHHYSLWKNYWKKVTSTSKLEEIIPEKNAAEDGESISFKAQRLQDALKYIIAKGFVFVGILTLDNNVLDEKIVNEGVFFKSKTKAFVDMQNEYRKSSHFPTLIEKESLEVQFLGQGERFFDLESLTFPQIAQMLEFFRGSFYGVVGEANGPIQFAILAQNITNEPLNSPMIQPKLDRVGRDGLLGLTKHNNFHPAAGFRLDYGIHSFRLMRDWGSLDLLGDFMQTYQQYLQYHAAQAKNQPILFESQPQLTLWDQNLRIITKSTTNVTPQKMSTADFLKIDKKTESKSPVSVQKTVSTFDPFEANTGKNEVSPTPSPAPTPQTAPAAGIGIQKPSIQPMTSIKPTDSHTTNNSVPLPIVSVPKLEKVALSTIKPLGKPIIPPAASSPKIEIAASNALQSPPSSSSEPSLSSESSKTPDIGYEDAFSEIKAPSSLIDSEKSLVMDGTKFDENFLKATESMLDSEVGRPIDVKGMTQDDIFKDLQASLDAMSKLDELSEKDAAVSRIYYPPPTLVSYANKEGMQIGGSTCVLSMGTGRNLWMVPELKRMQMWGKFYKDLEGTPQIEDFVAMDEKDITDATQFEDIIQKAFINIRKNNTLFMGLIEIEGNGFEAKIFEECPVSGVDIQKLMKIHIQRRETAKFPEISQEGYIDIKFYGQNREIIDNPSIQGVLDIAKEVSEDPRYSKGIFTGIVCVKQDAAYFFILSNNFDQLDVPEPKYVIDMVTLNKMYEMVESEGMIPVSWFKIRFGFQAFDSLFLWQELKDGPIGAMIQENYAKYFAHLMQSKASEDALKEKIVKDPSKLSKK